MINEVISQENDGVFTQSGNFHKTEKTMTVLRAIASWIRDLEDIPDRAEKNGSGEFLSSGNEIRSAGMMTEGTMPVPPYHPCA